jgi:modulator of FtsH protease
VEALSVTEAWESFFLGQLGASAALGGLLFVAVSINLERILALPTLPSRALGALMLIMAVLVLSSLMLLPGQPNLVLGIESLVVGVALWLLLTVQSTRIARGGLITREQHFASNVVLLNLAVLPYLVGGVLLVLGWPSGLYWVAASVILSTIKAMLDAWVLLVEINR